MVIVDYEMPMMTGLEAIKEIRALYSTINARIWHAALNQTRAETGSPKTGIQYIRLPKFALFSVHKNKAFEEFAMERGVDYFVDKPPNSD